MMTFKILDGITAKYLESKVTTYLAKGWKLHGTVIFVPGSGWHQAMTLTHRKGQKADPLTKEPS